MQNLPIILGALALGLVFGFIGGATFMHLVLHSIWGDRIECDLEGLGTKEVEGKE